MTRSKAVLSIVGLVVALLAGMTLFGMVGRATAVVVSPEVLHPFPATLDRTDDIESCKRKYEAHRLRRCRAMPDCVRSLAEIPPEERQQQLPVMADSMCRVLASYGTIRP